MSTTACYAIESETQPNGDIVRTFVCQEVDLRMFAGRQVQWTPELSGFYYVCGEEEGRAIRAAHDHHAQLHARKRNRARWDAIDKAIAEGREPNWDPTDF